MTSDVLNEVITQLLPNGLPSEAEIRKMNATERTHLFAMQQTIITKFREKMILKMEECKKDLQKKAEELEEIQKCEIEIANKPKKDYSFSLTFIFIFIIFIIGLLTYCLIHALSFDVK